MPNDTPPPAPPAPLPPVQLERGEPVPVPALDALLTDGGPAALIATARRHLTGEVPELSTDKGRKRVISLAASATKLKTTVTKALLTPEKRRLDERKKAVTAAEKALAEGLDLLRDEIRQPVTDWEAAEAQRKGAIQERIDQLRTGADVAGLDIDGMRERIAKLEAFEPAKEVFDEFQAEAQEAINATIASVRQSLQSAEIAAERAALEAERAEMECQRQAMEAERRREEAERAEVFARQQAEERQSAKAPEDAPATAVTTAAMNCSPAVLAAATQAAQADLEGDAAFYRIVRALLQECSVSEPQARSVATALVSGKIPHIQVDMTDSRMADAAE